MKGGLRQVRGVVPASGRIMAHPMLLPARLESGFVIRRLDSAINGIQCVLVEVGRRTIKNHLAVTQADDSLGVGLGLRHGVNIDEYRQRQLWSPLGRA